MEFKELIAKRRSVRKFTDREVPREVVDRILAEALSAPSARNTRTTRFLVVDDPVLVARMAEMRDYGSAFLKGAPLAVLVLGAARVWLFPHADGVVGNTLFWVVAMAIAGCLFVIPTAAEIPIVQTMMLAGMGFAPALALLITLPAVSVPSLIMLRKAFPAKALWLTGGLVALCGAVVGGLALL